MLSLTLLFFVAFLAALVQQTNASTEQQSHPHKGKVTPYLPGDPHVRLDENALETLHSGKPYQTQIQSGSSGRGLVVQDIHAPTDVVWERILDYDNYADMVPKTAESSNYDVIHHPPEGEGEEGDGDGHQTIYTRMKVGISFVKLQFFVKHEYYPKLNSLTWTLDYNRKSDFDDSCGYWYVVPHPDHPHDWSRVYYSVDVRMMDWVPTFVVNFMSKQALTEATGWVKKFSELEYAKLPERIPIDDGNDSSCDAKESTESLAATTTTDVKFQEDPRKSRGRRKRRRFLWFGRKISDEENEEGKNTPNENIEDGDTVASDETTDLDGATWPNRSADNETEVEDESLMQLEKQHDGVQNEDFTDDTTTANKVPGEVGLSRYLLLASVFGLSLYNIHLYFSQQ